MTTIDDLRAFFDGLDYRLVIAADGETRTHSREDGQIVTGTPAGGVAVAFDAICQVADATYIARARTEEDREVVDGHGRVAIDGPDGGYALRRLFLSPEEVKAYYEGYSNQTLWPLCHIAFEHPVFNHEWYEDYAGVNRKFADAIRQEMGPRTFVWINDYQLALVPGFLERAPDTVVGLFWHIPWPTWEIFRILPRKREILESLLHCDLIGFHRRYQVRNFLNAVDQELGARIDYETSTVHMNGKSVRVASIPMGVDVEVIRSLLAASDSTGAGFFTGLRGKLGLRISEETPSEEAGNYLQDLCRDCKILLGVDRLDYTKGIKERLMGIDRFYELNPEYRERSMYLGIMSLTRVSVPSYALLRKEVDELAAEINAKHGTRNWKPIRLVYNGFSREQIMDLYRKADVCLVTPLDDGMNLVSKEFVIAASEADAPGMLVLSQFAGSATDLSASVLVNPYDTEALAEAITTALEMPCAERKDRIQHMASLLEERNVYEWAISFVRNTVDAARRQQHEILQVG